MSLPRNLAGDRLVEADENTRRRFVRAFFEVVDDMRDPTERTRRLDEWWSAVVAAE